MTQKTLSVTFKRDTSGVTDRDISRAHALLKQGCHGVTVRDVTHRSVTVKRDSLNVTAQSASLLARGGEPKVIDASAGVPSGGWCAMFLDRRGLPLLGLRARTFSGAAA